jgi:hypothetical protein
MQRYPIRAITGPGAENSLKKPSGISRMKRTDLPYLSYKDNLQCFYTREMLMVAPHPLITSWAQLKRMKLSMYPSLLDPEILRYPPHGSGRNKKGCRGSCGAYTAPNGMYSMSMQNIPTNGQQARIASIRIPEAGGRAAHIETVAQQYLLVVPNRLPFVLVVGLPGTATFSAIHESGDSRGPVQACRDSRASPRLSLSSCRWTFWTPNCRSRSCRRVV